MKQWLKWDLGDFHLEESDLEMRPSGPGQAQLILGHTPLDGFLADLEQLGLLGRLRQRGYCRFWLGLEKLDLFSERLKLWGRHLDHQQDLLLMDIKSHRASLATPDQQRFRALGWDWVKLQDPCAQANPYRPLLPGQVHPGLGMFRSLIRLMLSYIQPLELEALTAVPMYFHNAVLYSESFAYLDPTWQGRLQALSRDLLHQGLAGASWAIERKQVESYDQEARGVLGGGCEPPLDRENWQPFEWSAALMVRPLAEGLRRYLASPNYQQQCAARLESLRFRQIFFDAAGKKVLGTSVPNSNPPATPDQSHSHFGWEPNVQS